jgi:Xaa-Pro aminopeptidase
MVRLCVLVGLIAGSLLAQPAYVPGDFLGKEWHKERRQKVREKLPPNSVAVFFANAVRNRSNDVDYVYHQDPDFYYLTGYREPHAVLLIFKEKQQGPNGTLFDEVIFVQPRNPVKEMWTGRRLGFAGVREQLGFEMAFNNTEFKDFPVDFSKFSQILFFDFYNDVRDNPDDPADLFNLIEQFKEKVGYPDKYALRPEAAPGKLNTQTLGRIMSELREIKTPEEIALLRKAVMISAIAQTEVMKAMRPGMSEREVQGLHEFIFKKYQAEDVGYPSIVGAGHNGCILHYIDNYKPALDENELILMDLGAEYHGYTADVTRTIPVGGKFSEEQKQIYNLVLAAQEEAIKICRAGTSFSELYEATRKVINKGLAELKIIERETDQHLYYPHGCCHHIGLDVHDRGTYNRLKENMVITIEPGIYIPENSNAHPRWRGIAVRIEDDFLVTQKGCELLSSYAPRTVSEIEAMMQQPSALDSFTLPTIKN